MFNRPRKNHKLLKIIGVVLISLFSLFLAFVGGAYLAADNSDFRALTQKQINYLNPSTQPANGSTLAPNTNFDLYWTVWNTLKQNYVDQSKINDNDFFYGSLKGMVSSLGDPYTIFLDPKSNQEFQDDLAGTFEGIGAEISLRNEVITIISPLEGMPAALAGLRAGDQILAINGTSTVGMTVDEAVRQIRGQKGTDVTLTVYRQGDDKTKDYTITRGIIVVRSVKTELRKDGLYVIKISAFNNDTWSLFDKAVKDVLAKKPKGVILDLRNNPGGYLDTAVQMASEWVEQGPVVLEKFSDEKINKYLTKGTARLKDYPTVVLVNKGSASASEIVAGALKDYNKATILGEKTFGKGSVQSLISFDDGSAVKITIAKWLTPNGDSINDEGVTPNEEVKLTPEDFNKDRDPQMDKAVNLLLKKKVNK